MPAGLIKYKRNKDIATLLFLSIVNWGFFLLVFILNHYGGIVEIYNYYFIPMVIFGLIGLLLSSRGELRHYLITSFFKSVCFCGLIGFFATVYEALTGQYILQSGSFHSLTYTFTSVTRANGLIGSALINGTIFGYLTITCLFLYYDSSKKRIYFVLVCIFFIGLVLTMSRGPLVSTVVGILLFFLLKEKRKNKRLQFAVITVALFIILVEVLLNIKTNNTKILRLQSIFNWTSEAGNVTRIYVWTSVINKMQGHMLWGMGIGALEYYNIPVTESGWLYVLFETGIAGLFVYLLPIFHFFSVALSSIKKNRNLLLVYCVSVVTAILVENTVLQVLTSLIVQIVFGVSIAFLYLVSSEEKTLLKE